MLISKVSFSEFKGEPPEWWFEPIEFGKCTLIVGRNATGKTRLLNVISTMAELLSGRLQEPGFEGIFHATFNENDNNWTYDLEHNLDEITSEKLVYNNETKIERSGGGLGWIKSLDADAKEIRKMRIRVERKKMAIVAKRDEEQHPYIENIIKWAESIRYFRFGSDMSQSNLAISIKNVSINIEIDEKATSNFVPILAIAIRKHADEFKKQTIEDMNAIGYEITDVTIERPANTMFNGPFFSGEVVGATVKESALKSSTNQFHMSTGMFRAFSLLAQMNYYMLSGKSGCIIIDDIGDGLDFERTNKLIELVRNKTNSSNIQTIMSTNNRFVMNHVPFEEWCVLHREGGHVVAKNYKNSKIQFDEFRMTGLNNFDLFATDYLFNTTEPK